MMRLATLTLLVGCALSLPAQSGSIDGVVLSAGGAPLDRAEVTLSTAGQEQSSIATEVTAQNGAFRFVNLAPGKYRLDASRRGYLQSAYQEHEGGYFTGVVVGAGADSHGLQFRLLPEAVIGGTVTDDSGEPVEGAQVTLYREDRSGPATKVQQAGTQTTDDTGEYEFARRRPGIYFVGVSATPWYAVHPESKSDDQGNPLPVDQQPRAALDVAYPMTFYANATESDAATPIALQAGDHQQINVSLHAVPAVHIQMHFLGTPGSRRGFNMPQITHDVFGSEQPLPLSGFTLLEGHSGPVTAELGGLPPGHYGIERFDSEGDERSHGTIDITSDQAIDLPPAASTVSITGKVAMLAGGTLPARMILTLQQDGRPGGPTTSVGTDGMFSFPAVAPGTYTVTPAMPDVAVVQMAASGAETNGNNITVSDSPVLLAATLVNGTATVTGFARRSGKGEGGTLVLLVPAGAKPNQDLFRMDQSDSDGSFTLYRVFPGNYTLVSIDGGWSLDWARPEVIAPYLARGLKVQITNQRTLNLSQTVEVQPR